MPDRFLRPAIIQAVGLVLVVAAAVFWAVTGRQSGMMLSSAVSMIGLGAYAELRHTLKTALTPAIGDQWEKTNDAPIAPTDND
jgi:hypothetical protein